MTADKTSWLLPRSRDAHREGVHAELVSVLEWWEDDPCFAELTLARMGEVAQRFARYVYAHDYRSLCDLDTDVCEAFVDAPTRTGTVASTNTRHRRRTTIRTLLRTMRRLGHDATDPTIDISLPPRSGSGIRPLTDDENTLGRTGSLSVVADDLRRPAAWALAETTAMTSETSEITTHDLMDHDGRIIVQLPGARTAYPRTVEATPRGSAILRRRLAELPAGASIVYKGTKTPGAGAAQAAVCNLIGVVLDSTGLRGGPGIGPSSVRLWRARLELDRTGSLEAAARLLGARSLDHRRQEPRQGLADMTSDYQTRLQRRRAATIGETIRTLTQSPYLPPLAELFVPAGVGRPRLHPGWVPIAYCALARHFGSYTRLDAELRDGSGRSSPPLPPPQGSTLPAPNHSSTCTTTTGAN